MKMYFSFREMIFFSYDHSNMQIFTVNITRVVWPHVTWGYALVQFCYSKKFTRAYLFQTALEIMWLPILILRLDITFWQEPRFCVVFSPPLLISRASHAIIDTDTNEYLPCIKIFVYVELKILEYVLFVVTNRCFGSEAFKSRLLLQLLNFRVH